MSPVLLAAVAAVALVALVIGVSFLRDIFDERSAMSRDAQRREDAARAVALGEAQTQRDFDIVAKVFDPIGLFHG